MADDMSEKELYEAAKKRVEEKKGFFIHLAVYIIVNTMLVLLWAFPSGGGYPWFLFPLGGWGIGITFHFLGVFVFSGKSDWERRAVAREIEKMRNEKH